MQEAYERARAFSDKKIDSLRQSLREKLPPDTAAITFGSYARREASEESDIDYIVVSDKDQGPAFISHYMTIAERIVGDVVPIEPSPGGAFAKNVLRDELLKNLGGKNDTNDNLTRRLLLILEGEWLTNEPQFTAIREELIAIYIKATPRDHQIALFLLNDIIRYWRTMTVDYMYKTTEDSKPWGIRNIKLIFSRKLMYASGLFSVGLTADKSEQGKNDLLKYLFSLPALDRIMEICHDGDGKRIRKIYNFFLEYLEDPLIREKLKKVAPGNHDDPIFRDIKNQGHNFTRELLGAYERIFHMTHPIRRAVLF